MRQVPTMLMIGSTGRNIGKTELACSLIKKHRATCDIVGIKVTTVQERDGKCPRGGEGCGVCSSLTENYCITEEHDIGTGKDTSRLLAAGASKVLWLRVMKEFLDEGISALLAEIGDDAISVCESNSLATVVRPGLFVMVSDKSGAAPKESAARVIESADTIALLDGTKLELDLDRIKVMDGRWILREDATAIVMAGGQSKRMRQDKGMMMVGAKTMITHICDQLSGNFGQVMISAADATKYQSPGVEVVCDESPGVGPLMGIASALKASDSELNLIVACDIPDIDLPLARQMLRIARDSDVVVPHRGEDMIEPLFAVYRKAVADVMFDAIAAGERRIRSVFDKCRVTYCDIDEARWLPNLNTVEDYDAYLKHGGNK